jgi:hypothetical protein
MIPMEGWGEADALANTMLLLASSDSSCVNGIELLVDGRVTGALLGRLSIGVDPMLGLVPISLSASRPAYRDLMTGSGQDNRTLAHFPGRIRETGMNHPTLHHSAPRDRRSC